MWLQLATRAIFGLQVLYRLVFHPLARFPGSKIAAATKWYEFFFDCLKGEGGQYAWEIQKMHEKYGPIVRINPNELHFDDPQYFSTIYAPSPARRDKWYPAAMMAGSPEGSFGTIDHFTHRKRKAANSLLFATKSVVDATPQIQLRANNLCNTMADHCRESVPVLFSVETLAFTTDLMTGIILGQPLGCQADKAVAERWFATTNCLPRLTPLLKQFPWIVAIALKLPVWVISVMIPDIALLASLKRQMARESQQHAQRRAEDETQDATRQRDQNLFLVIDNSDLPPDEASLKRSNTNFVAFGRGTRACQGQGYAWAMMYICVAQVVRRFDLELYETTYERDFKVKRDCFLGCPTSKSKGIRFKIKRDLANGLSTAS